MKRSDMWEGPQSSLKKTLDLAMEHEKVKVKVVGDRWGGLWVKINNDGIVTKWALTEEEAQPVMMALADWVISKNPNIRIDKL